MVFGLIHYRCWGAIVRGTFPSLEHYEILRNLRFDLVIDVGANKGQFSLMVHLFRKNVAIEAFEPLFLEASKYSRLFRGVDEVVLHNVAVGETVGSAVFHVSASRDSSSLLPIGELQTEFFPETRESSLCKVSLITLDSLSSRWKKTRQALLKIDVQGAELEVLRGAKETLKHCAFVYVECSHVTLYDGQHLFPEVAELLDESGFAQTRVANEYWNDERLIQADYLFERKDCRGGDNLHGIG